MIVEQLNLTKWMEVVRRYDLAVSSDSSLKTPREGKIASLHDDFYSWAKEQAALLKNGQANLLDYKNLAEELDDMGTSQESALESAIREALLYLLKLKYSPAEEPRNGWLISVSKQRTQIESVIRKNPGLKSKFDLIYNDAWIDARKLAIFACRVHNEHPNIPVNSPFSLGEVRNEDFFPFFDESSDDYQGKECRPQFDQRYS